MVPDSPKEEDSSDLSIPSINITAGTPPLLLSETAFVVEQSEANSSVNTSVTEVITNVAESATTITSLTESTGVREGICVTKDAGMNTSVAEVTNVSKDTSGSKETSATREETKEASSTRGTTSSVEAHLPSLTEVASLTDVSLTEAASSTTLSDGKMERQFSERRARIQSGEKSTRRRVRSSERGPERREPSRVTKTTGPSSERVSRRRSADVSALVQKLTTDQSPDVVLPKSTVNSTINEVNKSDSDGEQLTLQPSPAHRNMEEIPSLNSSRSSASSIASLPTTEEHVVAPSDHPPCTLGEKIMVETSVGFKFGKVKFIGPTEFSAGECIGIALERPLGKLASYRDILSMLFCR